MTATYDGVLSIASKAIQPCCATMHRQIVLGMFYVNAKGTISIKLDKGLPICCCPFCGAEVHP